MLFPSSHNRLYKNWLQYTHCVRSLCIVLLFITSVCAVPLSYAATFQIVPSSSIFIASPGATFRTTFNMVNGAKPSYYQIKNRVITDQRQTLYYKNNIDQDVFFLDSKQTKEITYDIAVPRIVNTPSEYTLVIETHELSTTNKFEKYTLQISPIAVTYIHIFIGNGTITNPKIRALNTTTEKKDDGIYINYKLINEGSTTVPVEITLLEMPAMHKLQSLTTILTKNKIREISFDPVYETSLRNIRIETKLLNNPTDLYIITERNIHQSWLYNMMKSLRQIIQSN